MKKLLVILIVAALPAPVFATPPLTVVGDDQFTPNNRYFTAQCWTFGTQRDDTVIGGQKEFKLDADAGFINPNGTPTGFFTVTSYARESGLFVNHNGGQGVLFGDNVDVSLGIPNIENKDLSKQVRIEVHFLGKYAADDTSVDALNSTSSFVSRDIVFDNPNIPPEDSWATLTEYWTISPQPDFEVINMTFFGTGADIDKICVKTICVPAPGALILAGIGVSVVGWLRRKQTI